MANKLGFYLHNFEIGEHKSALFDAIGTIQPPVMLVHAWDQVDQLRRLAPNALIIGRMDYFGQGQDKRPVRDLVGDWLNPDKGNPEDRGREFAEHILTDNFGKAHDREGDRLRVDAWMSLNEVVPGPASEQFQQQPEEVSRRLRAYDAFQVGFRNRLIADGIEAVAFNLAAGNFTTARHYLDFFPRTLASYTYLGFHEYGWPALSVELDPTAVSTAGTYRPIMTGIRQVTGREYQVILTEAGMTFMHKHPKSGFDKGWLFVPPPEFNLRPLSQDEYWRSLAWLNDTLNADNAMRGACLFEVSHHGDWETFRHFGQDNSGQPIRIVENIQQLAVAGPAVAALGDSMSGVLPVAGTLQGQVLSADEPVIAAAIRLFGGLDTLGADPHAVASSRGAVTWTRPLTGFAGSLWNCWQRYVAPNVAGITWEEFRLEAAQYNPALRESDDQLLAGTTYYLPENRVYADTRGSAPAVLWDRLLSGYAGDLWSCWRLHVQGKVVGLTWKQFQAKMGVINPGLAYGDERLHADQTYALPRNAGQEEYVRVAYSGLNGRFVFEELRPGTYRVEVSAAGHHRLVRSVTVDEDTPLVLTMEPIEIAAIGIAAALGVDDFVRVTDRHFTVGGRKFRFIGVNLRGLAHYELSEPVRKANAEQQLRAARDMGARVVRIFLPHLEVSVEDTRTRLIGLLRLMEEKFNDMYLIVAFANLYGDVAFRIPGDQKFYTHKPAGDNKDLLSVDWFREGYKENYLPFVRTILQDDTIRRSPRIMAYNIGNELKAEARDGDHNVGHPEALITFMHAMARQMRQWDDGSHLITTGMISTRHVHMGGNDSLRIRLYDIPELDFITNHAYHGDDRPETNLDQENDAPSREDDSDLADKLGKPLLIEETGIKPTESRRDRSDWVEKELNTLLDEKKAAGYMHWGFMKGDDNGDGDQELGLDHKWHDVDWNQLFGKFQGRATALADDSAVIVPPSGVFAVGQQVFTQTTVILRSEPSRQATALKPVPGRTRVTVTGASRQREGLVWWPVSVTLPPETFVGWMAQAVNGQTLLSAV